MAPMYTEIERRWQRQMLFSTLNGKQLRRVVAGILTAAWKAMKDVHATEFDREGVGCGERRTVGVETRRE